MNIAQVLKAEISRISKREAKALITPIRKSSAKIRPDVADLKNRLSALEKEVKRLNVLVINLASTQPAPGEAPEAKGWISGKGVKALRKKLGLTQGELAKLTGVSLSAVVQWERKPGMLKLRDATKKAIMAVRGIGKTEARQRLAELVPTKGKKEKVAKGKVRVKRAGSRRRK
jgi:DNA-binding transcriptional regulator YiaG